jgi:hypothetical protein
MANWIRLSSLLAFRTLTTVITSNDYNSFAWLALFDNHLDAESIQVDSRPIF